MSCNLLCRGRVIERQGIHPMGTEATLTCNNIFMRMDSMMMELQKQLEGSAVAAVQGQGHREA